ANFSSGYKVPSLYQLFSEYGNKILQPERSLNLEGGVQFLGNEGRSALRATYFKRNVKDVITFFFDPLTFQSQYINQDEQNDHGFEVDGKLLIGERFQLKAFYSFIDGEISTRQNGKDTSFFNLLRRPKSTLNLSFGAQINSRLFFNIQLNAVGKSKDIYFDPNTWQAVDVELKNYTLLNVYAEYMIIGNRLKLFADARNVLDQKYADIYGYNTAGLNAYGGIRIHF
ncbi:MAG: TonB-dependent receptor, partial [Flavisolibacter sp.]|nr:TonB-dependent receptor [Flavisolibacter sp.]